MDLGYGFIKGENVILKTRILGLLKESHINWYSFLWYISQYITITSYDEFSFTIKLFSVKQREFFYDKIRKYSNDIEENNYLVDKDNDLYKTHHKGYKDNKYILEKLAKENL